MLSVHIGGFLWLFFFFEHDVYSVISFLGGGVAFCLLCVLTCLRNVAFHALTQNFTLYYSFLVQ